MRTHVHRQQSHHRQQSQVRPSRVPVETAGKGERAAETLSVLGNDTIGRLLIQRQIEGAALLKSSLGSPWLQNREQQGGFEVAEGVETRINSARGLGQPLEGPIRGFMESRLGVDLAPVRVHSHTEAAQLSRSLDAQAFTVGRDVFFGEGRFAPDSSDGKHLLAHELTHVVQQGHAGPTRPSSVQRRLQPGERPPVAAPGVEESADRAALQPSLGPIQGVSPTKDVLHRSLWGAIKSVAKSVGSGISHTAKSVAKGVAKGVKKGLSVAGSITKFAGKSLAHIGTGIAKGVVGAGYNLGKGLLTGVGALGKGVGKGLWSLGKGVGGALLGVGKGVWNGAKGFWSELKKGNIGGAFMSFGKNSWQGIKDGGRELLKGIKATAKDIWGGIRQAAKNIGKGSRDALNALVVGLVEAGMGTWNDWNDLRKELGGFQDNHELKHIEGILFDGDPKPEDVDQGGLNDCFFLASLAAVARTQPHVLKQMIKTNGKGKSYTVTFATSGSPFLFGLVKDKVTYDVTPDFPADKAGKDGKLLYAQYHNSKDPNGSETVGLPILWPLVMEKAYAMHKGSYSRLDTGGNSADVLQMLMGNGAKTYLTTLYSTAELEQLASVSIAQARPTTASTGKLDACEETESELTSRHVYAVLDITPGKFKLYNPHGNELTVTSATLKKHFSSVQVG